MFDKKMYFEGWYFKFQNKNETLCIIPGMNRTVDGEEFVFIQIITKDNSYFIRYPYSDYYASTKKDFVRIGENSFSTKGCRLNIDRDDVKLNAVIKFNKLTPLSYDFMGYFKYFPGMECYHAVISMRHELKGRMELNGTCYDWNDSKGYIEKDWGHSFPTKYFWTQCNDFEGKNCSLVVSVANIPYAGLHFDGCVCVILYQGREYRFATYLGAKIELFSESFIQIKQDKYRFTVEALETCNGQELYAPLFGDMVRKVRENVTQTVRYRLLKQDRQVFELTSSKASFESTFNQV